MHSTVESERRTRIAGAAGDAVAAALQSPPRPGQVVAATPHAVLVTFPPAPDAAGRAGRVEDPALLCLADAAAVRLPCSILLARALPRVEPGARVVVGDSRITLPGYDIEVGRWWRVPRPTLVEPSAAAVRSLRLPTDASMRHTALPPEAIQALGHALTAPHTATVVGAHRSLGSPRRTEAARPDPSLSLVVRALVGLGEGLTPAGDDVLAGALVALTAARHPAASSLRAAVAAATPARRTTPVSAALLAHAARGECVPELGDLLTALDRDSGRATLDAAAGRLVRIGHTSGAALLVGVAYGLAAVLRSSSHPAAYDAAAPDPARKAVP